MKLWVIALALVCGCSKDNANYCANAPEHNCSLLDSGGGGDSPQGCQAQAECTNAAAPVCDLGKHECVACNSDYTNTCPSAAPVCDTANEACRKCVTHGECGSPGACLPDGSCGTDANVAWVAQAGADTGTCTHDAPCATITHALLQGKTFIKVAGMISDQPTIQSAVTILADAGAKVLPTTFGPVITVHGTGTVKIYDLTVTSGAMVTGDGIYVPTTDTPTLVLDRVTLTANTGHGLDVLGGSVTVSRCTVSNNTAGGMFINAATFDVSNTFITRNGNSTTGDGGAYVAATNGASSRFAFNTVADNLLRNTTLAGGGVTCDVPLFTAPNNILARNYVNNSTAPINANHAGQCTYPTSIDQTTITNLNFVLADNVPYDYHLGLGSVAIDQAVTAMNIDDDVDGDPRPQGTDKDQGADEYK
jgi:hypothetical protein